VFLRVLISCLLVGLLALGSQVSYGSEPDYGILRLSWKTVGEKIQVELAEQQDDVPVHMRAAEGTEDRMRDYQLTVEVDEVGWLDKLFTPPGFNRDRPITVFEELELPPGPHRLKLKFLPVPEDGATWKPEIEKTVEIEAGVIYTLELEGPRE